jgi:hypothetical protein
MSIKAIRLRMARSRPPAGEPWIWFTREMLESEAWRQLSAAAKMVVFRIAIEHMHHGGTENGALKVTYADFELYGVRRMSIRAAIESAVDHGFITITQPGRRSSGPNRWPAHYALTWLALKDGSSPSNAWRRCKPAAPYTQDIRGSSGIATRRNGGNPMGPSSGNATGIGSETLLAQSENATRENKHTGGRS